MAKASISAYFGEHAVDWGKHYQGTSVPRRMFNGIFRRALKQRWDLTMKHALPAAGKTYVDIGCGTGEYSIALGEAGAALVTGIDFAGPMIDLSRRLAEARGLSDRCEFIAGDFMKLDLGRTYDMAIAVGVFDYVADYEAFWQKMIALSTGVIVASFPGHSPVREPVRKLRYRRKGFPVYFYSRDQLESLANSSGLAKFAIEILDGGYFLVGFTG
jgi:2-polyprenyl-3-methyl-5-hydroxy-6-metoxy-1,4-benzoquinol methylase